MKGIIKTYLNLRMGKPDVNAPNPLYYNPGYEVEIIDAVVGSKYRDNSIWFRLGNGGFVWSGGVSELSNIYDYYAFTNDLTSMNIDGEGIEIAIIDSGISSYLNFKDHINWTLTNKFAKENKYFNNYEDKNGHGTSVASIISCTSPGEKICFAPKAKLVICKITENRYEIYDDIFCEALQWCLDQDSINIINCSLALESKNEKLNKLIKDATNKNKLIICAVDDIRGLASFPASYNEVFSVGAIDQFDFQSNPKIKYPDTKFFGFGKNINILNTKGIVQLGKGSSYACAFSSSYAALALNTYKRRFGRIPDDIFNWLYKLSLSTAREKDNPKYNNGIIDPISAVKGILN